MHKSDVMNWFRPVVSFDVDDRQSPSLSADLIDKIRSELSSIGDREVFAGHELGTACRLPS